MPQPENTFIASVHRHLPPTLYRMKNHNQYNGGIADVWYSGRKDLWVEYKFITLPKRPGTLINLTTKLPKGDSVISTLQQEWLRARHQEGRRIAVIIGCKDGGVWCPDTSWGASWTAAGFRALLQPRSELALIIQRVTS